jgi:integrase/recombinase XerD
LVPAHDRYPKLNEKGERTQQAYTRSVRMLSEFYGKTPDLLSEQELQDYFLHRKNVNHWSRKTMRLSPWWLKER